MHGAMVSFITPLKTLLKFNLNFQQVLIEVTYDLNHQIAEVAPIILSEVYRIFEADTVS